MKGKSTDELNEVLGKTHISQMERFLKENEDSILQSDRPFADYMRQIIKEKGIRQQDIFLQADIPERYGFT